MNNVKYLTNATGICLAVSELTYEQAVPKEVVAIASGIHIMVFEIMSCNGLDSLIGDVKCLLLQKSKKR